MASNPSIILQLNRTAWQDETVDDDFVRKSLVQLRRAQLRAATDLLVSKFVQYDVLNPPDNAVDASKFVQYVVANPPDNAVDASKFVQFSVIEAMPSIKPPPYAFWTRNRNAWQDDTDAEEQANSARLLNARRIPTQTRVDDNTNLSGVAVAAHVGAVISEIDNALTGVAATTAIGTPAITISKALSGVAGAAHAGTPVREIDTAVSGVQAASDVGSLAPMVDANPALSGVEAVASLGTLAIEGDVSLSGVEATTGIGDLTEQADANATLSGVEAAASVGILAAQVNRDASVTGVEAVAEAGTPTVAGSGVHVSGVGATANPGTLRPWVQKTLGFPPGLFDPYRGVVATTGIGAFAFSSDRVLNGVQASAQAGRLRVLGSLEGVQANTGIGRMGFQPGFPIFGIQATAQIGQVFVHTGPNETIVNLTGVQASARVGTPTFAHVAGPVGVQAQASVGTPLVIIVKQGLTMSELDCAMIPTEQTGSLVSLRWSDDKGESYSNAVTQTLGTTGEYITNMQWRRLGMARDRIFELSWSSSQETALTGAFINVTESKT